VSYEWDVFISYRRAGNVTGWVRNHFVDVLTRCLEDELDRPPRVFVDKGMEVGAYWPDELADALLRSRYMVAIWSPPYFTSSWCVAEWQSMRSREAVLGIPAPGVTMGLVYPVVFSDGDSFPAEARAVQSRLDLSQYGFPYEQFNRTESYLEFHAKVRAIACDLAPRFAAVPAWDANWPICRPEPFPPPPPEFPRLA
jgi:hypothetical protein